MADELTNYLNTLEVQYPNAPQPTPALLAFLNGLGMTMSTATQARNMAIQRIDAATNQANADINRSYGRTKQNVTADLVRRGVLSSGEANTRYARAEEDVATKRRDLARQQATAKEDAELALRQSKDTARMQALDRVIATEQDQATAAATQAANEQNWQRQLDLINQQNTANLAAQEAANKAQIDAINAAAQQGVAV